jgi:hypothetical protein
LAGGAASWDGVKTNRKRAIEAGDMFVVLQCVPQPLREIPNVPKVIDFAKTQEQRKYVQILIHDANDYSRPFAVPPGTPKDRVEILRNAFQQTMKDKEFLAEIDKMKLTLIRPPAKSWRPRLQVPRSWIGHTGQTQRHSL